MYGDSDKVILVDCDGVLLEWLYHFQKWMYLNHGRKPIREGVWGIDQMYGMDEDHSISLVEEFNRSADIARLSPFRDAIHGVRKLHEEHGYIFHVITALSRDQYAATSRRENLERVFGLTAIDRLVCLNFGEDKYSILKEYQDSGCIWIEDNFHNANTGKKLGLRPYLMAHPHNSKFTNKASRLMHDIPVINNWKELLERIT